MLAYGLNFQLITISQALREPVTKALLTKFGGLAMTGYYDLASRWVVNFRELIVQANQVLVPTISSLQERDPHSIPKIYRESYRLIFFLAIPAFAFLVVISPLVSRIWIGGYEPVFVRFVALLALGWLVNTLSNPAYVVDLGTGALGWVSIGCVSTAILTFTLGLVLGKHFGGTAVVASSVASLAFGYIVVVVSHHLENALPFGLLLPKESAGIALSSLAGAVVFLPLFCSAPVYSLYSLRISAGLLAAVLTIAVPMWIHPLRKRLAQWFLSSLPA
jgi:O-antigen/teichoic acid export membrane protein